MKKLLFFLMLCSCAKSNDVVAPQTTEEIVSQGGNPCLKKVTKNLLIIGDSISMGYNTYVQTDLCGFYNVQHVSLKADLIDNKEIQNAQGTTFTLANLDRWLDQAGPLDVIVWNNGLWNARDPATDSWAPGNATDLNTYESELIQIANKLKATGARVIFFTTTDIPASGSTFIPGRDILENVSAKSIMSGLGVETYDLYALAIQNPKLHLATDPIHFNTQGYTLFGEFISAMVLANYVN